MEITLIPPNSLCSFLKPLFAHFSYSNYHWVLKIPGIHPLLFISIPRNWLPSFLTWITPMVWSEWLHPYILALTYLYSTLTPEWSFENMTLMALPPFPSTISLWRLSIALKINTKSLACLYALHKFGPCSSLQPWPSSHQIHSGHTLIVLTAGTLNMRLPLVGKFLTSLFT